MLAAGLHCSEIISGYTKAGLCVQTELETLAVHQLSDIRNLSEVSKFLKSTIDAKQYSYSSLLTPIIAQACIDVCPSDPRKFNIDSIRTVKILGGGVADTQLVRGFALTTGAEGTIRHVVGAKIGVFVSGIDIPHTEVKGTLRFRTGQELEEFARSEEQELEAVVQQIKASGCNVVVSGQAVGELALHFLERYGIMVLKVQSKFQLRRLCQATKARPLVRLGAPTADEIGSAASVSIDEVGSLPLCTISVDSGDESEISTIVIRGSSTNICDDVERCIDDGVHAFRAMALDSRFVAGAGASEIELANRLSRLGESTPGLDQYAIKKYAEALEVVPRILAENSSMKTISTISALYAAHTAGSISAGIDVDASLIGDAVARQVFDSFLIKANALRLATETVITLLNVDQIIMAKPAGGPKIPNMGGARDSLSPYS